MLPADRPRPPALLPDAFTTIPIEPGDDGALHICLIVRSEPDPASGHYVIVRDTADARVHLGCIVDHCGVVHQWIEVWVQDLTGLREAPPSYRDMLNNERLDTQWRHRVSAFDQMAPHTVVHTGYEEHHASPRVLDPEARTATALADADGTPWTLCTDDHALERAGLPSYHRSLHRYLWRGAAAADGEPRFVAVTADAPVTDRVNTFDAICQPFERQVVFNQQAGLLLVRPYDEVSLEGFTDVLGGEPIDTVHHGRDALLLSPTTDDLHRHQTELDSSTGRLFLGRHGRTGRMIEALHLKLRLLADAMTCVRTAVAASKSPLLNLTADSFRVDLPALSVELPTLWTARLRMAVPGDATLLPLAGTDARYFVRPSSGIMSVYQPTSAGRASHGAGIVRLRRVQTDDRQQTVAEGTLVTQDRLEPASQDLIWLRANVGDQRVNLYVRAGEAEALAGGEWRFNSVAQRLDASAAEAMKSAEGLPLQNVPFEVVPQLSSPCDLYALGVLATRLLLVDRERKLPVVVDEVLSLARQVGAEFDRDTPLPDRVRAIMSRDERWLDGLGPHRVVFEEVSLEEALDIIPAGLWYEALALIVRLLPGFSPDCPCRDFGDASPAAPELVFDHALTDLHTLLVRTRSLIVIDWRFNREIHRVLRQLSAGMTGVS